MGNARAASDPGQGLRTRAKRTTGKQGLRYTPRPVVLFRKSENLCRVLEVRPRVCVALGDGGVRSGCAACTCVRVRAWVLKS